MKKKGIRLWCAGVAASLLWSSTVYAIEIVPPNPFTGNLYGATSAISAAENTGTVNTGTVNTENVILGASPSSENGAAGGNVPATGSPAAGESLPAAGNAVVGESLPTVDNAAGVNVPTGNETAGTNTLPEYSPLLEGTVFPGSAAVAAPTVSAQGAVLLNCGTGQILFEKNGRTPFYPASITKIMTALLTAENCNLDDVVTFSQTATTNLESGAVTLNLTAGDQLTVRDSLYALLLKSANEVANGLAEHMAGSVDNFSVMMNTRAAQLGCSGTHFANPNGLNNASHLTTPYDMALIARAAYANPIVSQVSTTVSYPMPATLLSAAKTITMGHKMLYSTDSRYYPGMVGGKTGYTSKAGNTLVTCVERDGVRLVAVIMKASGTHYTDTKALLDYGFALAANGEIAPGNPAYAGMPGK